jgi:hypothetical protein
MRQGNGGSLFGGKRIAGKRIAGKGMEYIAARSVSLV